MQRIRIERRASHRDRRDGDPVLPLDPRDPDIVRAKLIQRRSGGRPAPSAPITT